MGIYKLIFLGLFFLASFVKGAGKMHHLLPDEDSLRDKKGLRSELIRLSKSIHARVGISITILETRDTLEINGNDPYPMQSTYKYPIALFVLHEVDLGKWKLNQEIQLRSNEILTNLWGTIKDSIPMGGKMKLSSLISHMIQESDNTACDVLIDRMGGCETINRWVHSLGVREMEIKTNERIQQSQEKIQYKNWAWPRAFNELSKLLVEGKVLSKESGNYLLYLMANSNTGAKRIRAGLPKGTYLAHKTGSSSTINGFTAATNDAGIIRLPNGNHLALTVFVSDSNASQEKNEGLIARISKAVWDFYK